MNPPMSQTSSSTSTRKPDPAWPLILAAATSVLVIGLQLSEPLGSDEVWTFQTIQQGFGGIVNTLRADVHPPFYFLLLKCWTILTGTSDLALQSFSALCFVLSQWALYTFFARRGQKMQGAFAVVFLLNPLGLLVCHFARMYSLLMLLQLLSLLLWWRISEEKGGSWLFFCINVLGSFTHIWFFFHMAALFAVSLLDPAHPRRRVVLLSLPLALLPYAALWGPTLLQQLRLSSEAGAWLPRPGLGDLMETLLLQLVLAIPALAAIGLYWIVQRKLPPWPKQASLLALWMVLFLGIPFALSWLKPIYYQRFTIGALPVFALLAAFCLPQTQRVFQSAVLVAITVFIACFSVFQYRNPSVCSSRWSAAFLEQRLAPGDRILFTSLAKAPVQHYSGRVASSSQSFPSEIDAHPGYEPNYARLQASGDLQRDAAATAAALAQQKVPRIWLVHGFRPAISETISGALTLYYQRQQSASFSCNGSPCYHNQLDLYVLKP